MFHRGNESKLQVWPNGLQSYNGLVDTSSLRTEEDTALPYSVTAYTFKVDS